jgi:DNA polymerase III epsilon subunit-like protein
MSDLVLVFDTETTGLPNWSAPSDHPDQPHIVSLAAELCTPSGEVIETYNEIVNIGVPIPPETTAIHGITDAIAAERGLLPKVMLAEFFKLVDRAGLVVGYNTSFDLRMVRIQAARHFGEKWDCPIPKDDAMWIVAKAHGIKKPKLIDAHQIVFGKPFDGAHSAMADCSATRAIYFEMVKRGYVAENPRAAPGGNMPPETVDVVEAASAEPEKPAATPLQAHTAEIEDLYEEAHNWLDGTPIANQAQADEVTRLYDLATKAGKAADAARVVEKKPHDDAATAVQRAWKPLVEKAGKIATGTKGALGKWMIAEQTRQREEARIAREAADAIAEAARQKHVEAQTSGDLNMIESVEADLREAKRAERVAVAADQAKPIAKVEGMSRGLGLKTVYDTALADTPKAANELAAFFWTTQKQRVVDFYLELARESVKAGARSIPGTIITSRQVV